MSDALPEFQDITDLNLLRWQYEYLQIQGTKDQVRRHLSAKYPTLTGAIFYHVPTATAYVPANYIGDGGSHETV